MRLLCVAVMLAALSSSKAIPQVRSSAQPDAPVDSIKLAVDEVGFTFHASDAHDLPVNDLRLDELTLLDNGLPPRRVVSFSAIENAPIRAGILLDTSQSMAANLAVARSISARVAQRILRQPGDQGFVMAFGYISSLAQPWTSDPGALMQAVNHTVTGRQNPLGGTALYDTVFRACFHEFGKADPSRSGNFVLLFSDGEDNSSHTSLPEVIDICQRSNTAVYAFRAEPGQSMFAGGAGNLAQLAEQTGGRVFPMNESDAAIDADLRTIEANQRNQYRLIYNPPALPHDGAFHRIELKVPSRVESLTVRSGYYDRPR